MQLSLIGLDHQSAPIEIRENVAIPRENLSDALSLLHSYVPVGIILSTCNRTEIYTVSDSNDGAEKKLRAFFEQHLGISDVDLLKYVYTAQGEDAVKHLFMVVSGLKSLVIGEFEILGQVKHALEAAEKANMIEVSLQQTFYRAIRTGRRVREETGISKNAMSVSSIAMDLAAKVVGELSKCRLLIIGAGEAGTLVTRVANKMGVTQMCIVSRTKDKSKALALSLHGTAADIRDLPYELSIANIIVTCSSAPHWVLDNHKILEAMTKRPSLPLVIIDIALPRNVEPGVGNIPNVVLYDIDDLNSIAKLNRRQRESEIHRVEEIVMDEVSKSMSWWRDLEIRPLLVALMSRAEKMRSTQLTKTLKKLPPLSDEQRENLEAMTKSIVIRLLKDPVKYLQTNVNGYNSEMVKELFNLDSERH